MWVFPGNSAFSMNKTNCDFITEILFMKFGVRNSSVVQSNADEIRLWLIKGTMMVDGLINHNNKKIFLQVSKEHQQTIKEPAAIHLKKTYICQRRYNRIGGVMISVLAPSVVDRAF